MKYPADRTKIGGAAVQEADAQTVPQTADVPAYPHGGDPRRRIRLHHRLRRRRRWSP